MSWDTFAPRFTRVSTNQTDSAILSGATCRIYNIVCAANGGAGTVTLEKYGTTTVIATFEILSGDTVVLGGNGFLADGGVQVTTSANATCTVFHSGPGA